MTTRRAGLIRTLAAIGMVGASMLSVAGCATDSPKEQIDREHKAASVPVFKLHMEHDLWSRTNSDHVGDSGRKVDKPKSLTDDPATGMATIELTGPQMVDYLQILDYNAHGGMSAHDPSLAGSVYDAVAPVVDKLQTPPAPDAPAPEVTVSAAVKSSAPTTAAAK
ncbi:hypothetical protein OHB26_39650 (plasmid) [Nocardia sp. NBC_01503]|uniref:hypothetical protein n=1 Tax=Nocardia sp. NBC_01503 TaxID=2975997 RepID=UPI002E7B0C7A|nr:hypothetical protein [Nocardia sp. NBC_01503]WTL36653.1 hypothetical protein OHB26_38925 [Nocardia sp. NBC_01503]WTL36794.1 hypothetical protein OHB26_39650 [Nocardia sp. NBC_01503]